MKVIKVSKIGQANTSQLLVRDSEGGLYILNICISLHRYKSFMAYGAVFTTQTHLQPCHTLRPLRICAREFEQRGIFIP
jgi:hypothetical protein